MLSSSFVELTTQDYIDAFSRLANFAKKNAQLRVLGQFGEVKNPTISDLDIFICFDDDGFASSRNSVLDFIRSDSVLRYLCTHDPVIVPLSMLGELPLLHTVYNLRITYSKVDTETFLERETGYGDFLNKVWATSLIPISANVISRSEDFDDRYKLLLLKNIHQSISNFDKSSDALIYSQDLRNNVIGGKAKPGEIDRCFRDATFTLLATLDDNFDMSSLQSTRQAGYKLTKNTLIVLSDQSGITPLSIDKWRIELSMKLFLFFEHFFYLDSIAQDAHYNLFVDSSMRVHAICEREIFPYPFVPPFYFSFFRNDLRFKIRKRLAILLA